MNNTRLKLHNFLQNTYERSRISSNPKHYFPVASEFTKELFTNPLVEDILQTVLNSDREAFVSFQKARSAAFREIEATIQLLFSYKEIVPEFVFLDMEYENSRKHCPQNSGEIIDLIAIPIIEKAHFILLSKRFSNGYNMQIRNEILSKLAKHDEKGVVTEFIFAPSLPMYHETREILEREQKNTLYKSISYLDMLYASYDLRELPKRLQRFLDNNHHSGAALLKLKAQQLSQILDGQTLDSTITPEFDVEECKIHVNRAWTFVKPRLLIKGKAPAISRMSFVIRDTRIIVRSKKGEKTFDTKDRTGRFLKAFLKKPSEPIPYKTLWKKVEDVATEEELGTCEENQLNETRKSVNKQLTKIGLPNAFQKTKTKSGNVEKAIKKIWLNPQYSAQ